MTQALTVNQVGGMGGAEGGGGVGGPGGGGAGGGGGGAGGGGGGGGAGGGSRCSGQSKAPDGGPPCLMTRKESKPRAVLMTSFPAAAANTVGSQRDSRVSISS